MTIHNKNILSSSEQEHFQQLASIVYTQVTTLLDQLEQAGAEFNKHDQVRLQVRIVKSERQEAASMYIALAASNIPSAFLPAFLTEGNTSLQPKIYLEEILRINQTVVTFFSKAGQPNQKIFYNDGSNVDGLEKMHKVLRRVYEERTVVKINEREEYICTDNNWLKKEVHLENMAQIIRNIFQTVVDIPLQPTFIRDTGRDGIPKYFNTRAPAGYTFLQNEYLSLYDESAKLNDMWLKIQSGEYIVMTPAYSSTDRIISERSKLENTHTRVWVAVYKRA